MAFLSGGVTILKPLKFFLKTVNIWSQLDSAVYFSPSEMFIASWRLSLLRIVYA